MVILTLWFIFLFTPHVAHVSLDSNNIEAIRELYASRLSMKLETEQFSLSDFDELRIGCFGSEGFVVNDQLYDNSYNILVKPYDKTLGTIFVIMKNGKMQEVEITSFSNEKSQQVCINYTDDESSINYISGFQMVYHDDIYLTFSGSDAYLIKEGVENIPIYSCIIKCSNKYDAILSISSNVKLNLMDYLGQVIETQAYLDLWGIGSIYSKVSGDLYFSYTPTSTRYHLNYQTIHLGSSENNLEANVLLENGLQELAINGMVDKATISNMNLFPTFLGWYKDNIYLAPLTLLTTIFGGVTLMINNKKKT